MTKKITIFVSLLLGVASAIMGIFASFTTAQAGIAYGDRVQPLQDIGYELYLSTSSTSVVADAQYALPKYFTASSEGPILLDFNGDGLTDIIQAGNNSGASIHYVLLNTGDGFEIAYSCRINITPDPDEYQGTCADL